MVANEGLTERTLGLSIGGDHSDGVIEQESCSLSASPLQDVTCHRLAFRGGGGKGWGERKKEDNVKYPHLLHVKC